SDLHLIDAFDIGELLLAHALARNAEHVGREINAGNGEMRRIARQRNAGAYAHFKQLSGATIDNVDGALATGIGDGTEGEVINGRPSRIGLDDRLFVYPRKSTQDAAPRLLQLG